MRTTDELNHDIQNVSNIDDFLANNQKEMLRSLSEHIKEWMCRKKCSKVDVIKRTGTSRNYLYEIFSGKKYPSRDKILLISFGMQLNYTETQQFLKQAGYRELYPRDPRDALLIFALNQKQNLIDTNILLESHQQKPIL